MPEMSNQEKWIIFEWLRLSSGDVWVDYLNGLMNDCLAGGLGPEYDVLCVLRYDGVYDSSAELFQCELPREGHSNTIQAC